MIQQARPIQVTLDGESMRKLAQGQVVHITVGISDELTLPLDLVAMDPGESAPDEPAVSDLDPR